MWTEAGGEKEMFLYRYPSLSAHHLAASWPWHHGGPGLKAEETIGSWCWSGACLRPTAATSADKLLLSGFGLTHHIRKCHRSVCIIFHKFWMSPTCFEQITSRWRGLLIYSEHAVNEPELQGLISWCRSWLERDTWNVTNLLYVLSFSTAVTHEQRNFRSSLWDARWTKCPEFNKCKKKSFWQSFTNQKKTQSVLRRMKKFDEWVVSS